MASNDTGSKSINYERRIQELNVLVNELNSLKKNATVYRQQRNSNVYFKDSPTKVLSETKKELDSLKKKQNKS